MNTSFEIYQNIRIRQSLSQHKKDQLAECLAQNSHTLVVMSPEEFVDFAVTQKKKAGKSEQQICEWFDRALSTAKAPSIGDLWHEHNATGKTIVSYIPTFFDTWALGALAIEMKRGGAFLTKYQIKSYGGKNYIILKGYAGLRRQLTGTRYLASSPKIMSMAIGKLGAAKSINGGFVTSIVFSVAFHSIEQLINDKATWHYFVAGVAVDIAAATAGSAIAWAIVSQAVGATAMAAIGPIALVVVVGALTVTALNLLFDHYQLTQKLADLLKESERRMLDSIEDTRREIRRGLNYADEDPVGFMHRLFGLPYMRLQR